MGQLIKTRFHKWLGLDKQRQQLKYCGAGDFSEWLFYHRGKLLTAQGIQVERLTADLVVAANRNSRADIIRLVEVEGGFAIERDGHYVSDRKGLEFGLAREINAWEVFKPQ